MKIEYPDTGDMPVSDRPFSPVVKVGNLLFVSGQASVDDSGRIIPDTFEGEFRRAMDNIRRILESAGSGLEHVVQTRNYIGDACQSARFNELYREYFNEPYPARTTISNCLGELRYEIECIAVIPEPKRWSANW